LMIRKAGATKTKTRSAATKTRRRGLVKPRTRPTPRPLKPKTAAGAAARKIPVDAGRGGKARTSQPAKKKQAVVSSRGLRPSKSGVVRGAARPTRAKLAARVAAKPVPKWMEEMRRVLESERERLRGELEDVGNFSNLERRGFGTEMATTDDDTIDMASEAAERERELALRSNLEDLLDRVEVALAKIDQNEYGVCERCGRKISKERLKAVPHATMCVPCRQIVDG
jgi:RNA polymerase-binding protein DksA